MKKVGIITFHHAKQSYGAVLQAIATLAAVRKLGYEAELIDYENEAEQNEIPAKKTQVAQKLYVIASWVVRMFIYQGIKAPCRNRKYLNQLYGCVSKEKFKNLDDLNRVDYDILIAGSDQIWNPQKTDGLDSAFLLNFGTARKRISYASSLGSHILTEQEKVVFNHCLGKFSWISVREQRTRKILEGIVKRPVQVVCDPTFLLNRSEWQRLLQIENPINNADKYILTYFVGSNINFYWDKIEGIVKELGLPVYNVQSHARNSKHTEKTLYNLTPGELVSYIDCAECIITDSFHGTVFSILSNKKFVSVSNDGNPVRVADLLYSVGITGTLDPVEVLDCRNIDYKTVNQNVEIKRNDSMEWLRKALCE